MITGNHKPRNLEEPINISGQTISPLNIKLMPEKWNNNITSGGFYYESNFVNTTVRTVGMPQNSNDDLMIKLTSPSQLQITSTATSDNSTGTDARTIGISGLIKSGTTWTEIYEEISLNGQTPVNTVSSIWWRINDIFVLTKGALGETNLGDIYVSISGSSTTAGVPASGTTLFAMLAGHGRSSFGFRSVPSGKQLHYHQQDFFSTSGTGADLRINEFYFENFDKTDDTNLIRYEVATYTNMTNPVPNQAYQPYDEKSDIHHTISRSNGSQTDPITFYFQHHFTKKGGNYMI